LKKPLFPWATRSWWLGAAAGAAASLASIALQRGLDSLLSVPMMPPAVAIGAVICVAVWVGPVAAWTATCLMTVWCAIDLTLAWGYSALDVSARCAIFAAEAAVLSFFGTELFRSRGALQRSNTRQRQLLDTSAEGILVHSGAGVITYGNERMAELLAVGSGTLQNRKFEEFVFPEDLSA